MRKRRPERVAEERRPHIRVDRCGGDAEVDKGAGVDGDAFGCGAGIGGDRASEDGGAHVAGGSMAQGDGGQVSLLGVDGEFVASIAGARKGMAKRASRRQLERRARLGGTVDESPRNRIASRSPEPAVWRETIRQRFHITDGARRCRSRFPAVGGGREPDGPGWKEADGWKGSS